jgi:hypothetical protein
VLRLREHVQRLEQLHDAAERQVAPFPPQGRRDRSRTSDRAM